MKKIPTLYARDFSHDPRYVTRDVTPGCEWVLKGEGTPTRKYDGTCVMFDGEKWWARREVKPGKLPPPGFVEVEYDEETGKTIGWEPGEQSPFAKWLAQADAALVIGARPLHGSTYELVGPKVNGNPEGYSEHHLIEHAEADRLPDAPRDFDGLAAWLHAHKYEGIVWHHPDGRMAKIKKRDFPA
jgi:hypothetical protein